MHHGVIRIRPEQPLADIADQLGEPVRIVLGVAHASREQRVAGENVRRALRVLVHERDRPRGMAAQVHCRHVEAVEVADVPVIQQHIHRHRQLRGVIRPGRRLHPGGRHQARQRTDMVPVLVGGGNQRQLRRRGGIRSGVGKQPLDGGQIIGRIDQELRARDLAGEQIHVVVHLADRNAADGDVT